jgi:hypothetical protein
MCVCTHIHTQGNLSEIHILLRRLWHHPAIFSRHVLHISQHFPEGNFGIRLSNVINSVYGTFQKNCASLKLPKSGCVNDSRFYRPFQYTVVVLHLHCGRAHMEIRGVLRSVLWFSSLSS